jgi:5-(carboxyamino)imidazole ribonucleotide synthase
MTPLPPGSIIGILGGGQLGRMLAVAAAQLGYRVAIYAPGDDIVAADVAAFHVDAEWDDEEALREFAQDCDVVTFEWENIPVAAAKVIEAAGILFPSATILETTQDRLAEKAFAAASGLTVPAHAEIVDPDSLVAALASVGTPAILKTAREGYDGKGQARIRDGAQSASAWESVGQQRCIFEAQIDFLGEFSVILARGQDGVVRHWDAPENRHDGGILVESRLPRPSAWAAIVDDAVTQATALASRLNYVGAMAVEFFATAAGPVFNEIAPRVHNSGHWTIEGAVTSQFENHIRAICGLPLGDTATRSTPVVMRNLIGDAADCWAEWLVDPAAKLHLYGKGAPRPGRKMGHVTWVGSEPQ